ncbi:MAG: hypothetical protein ABIC57_00155 [bacterium]
MAIDFKCVRYAQKGLCVIRTKISITEFIESWIKEFGDGKTESDKRFLDRGGGIEDFYEDYLTSGISTLKEYFKRITENES